MCSWQCSILLWSGKSYSKGGTLAAWVLIYPQDFTHSYNFLIDLKRELTPLGQVALTDKGQLAEFSSEYC
jgi:hypothetical protein